MNNFVRLILLFIFPVLIYGCKSRREEKESPPSETKNLPAPQKPDTIRTAISAPLKITYHLLALDDSVINSLKRTYPDEQLQIILSLNRIDYEKLFKTDHLVIPDTFLADLEYYSPFPDTLSILDSVQKILILSYPVQAFAAYELGKLVRWGPTSMGKKSTPTPSGLYHTNWKAKQTVSTENPEWILNWYFNLLNFSGISLHQYELPGFPASHSCARLRADDAEWIYYWAQQWRVSKDDRAILARGTPVIIYGNYAFEKPAPWLALMEDAGATDISASSLVNVITPYLKTILERQMVRDSVIALDTAL